jgi:hypothetical protein
MCARGGRIDRQQLCVRLRRAHEVQVHGALEQRITHVGDIRAAGRQQPRVLSPDDPLAEDAHGPTL